MKNNNIKIIDNFIEKQNLKNIDDIQLAEESISNFLKDKEILKKKNTLCILGN